MSKKIGMIVFGMGLILIFGLLLGASLLTVKTFGPAPLTAITATSIQGDEVIDFYLRDIEGYDKELKKPLPPDAKNYYEGMKKYAETKIAERKDELSNMDEYIKRKKTAIVEATLSPVPKGKNVRQLGLLNVAEFKKIPGIRLLNGWVEAEGNSYILYLAGYVEDDPEQGVVYIIHDATWEKEKFVSPLKEGSFKINGFEKNRLILTTSKGKNKYFDTKAKMYADNLDEPIIDVTLTPTVLPAYP